MRSLLLWSLCMAARSGGTQLGGDLQAQIVYAYQTEDANRLASIVQTLSSQVAAGGADSGLRYHLAHAQYRVGLLAAVAPARRAASAFAACIDQLKPVLEQDGDSVEALALQSACYSGLARFERLRAVLLRGRAADRLDAALRLAPRNPRVIYLSAMVALTRAKRGSDESQRGFAQLLHAAQLFEQSSATGVDAPGWGHAEAYLELGRQLQSRGDVLGARNWIEKALIIAPDFKSAQRQLASLTRQRAGI